MSEESDTENRQCYILLLHDEDEDEFHVADSYGDKEQANSVGRRMVKDWAAYDSYTPLERDFNE